MRHILVILSLLNRLREELRNQKKKFQEAENQFRQENQELMHLYIDAEVVQDYLR